MENSLVDDVGTLGTAGFEPVLDLVSTKDLFDRALEASNVAVADELAARASFMMGQAAVLIT